MRIVFAEEGGSGPCLEGGIPTQAQNYTPSSNWPAPPTLLAWLQITNSQVFAIAQE